MAGKELAKTAPLGVTIPAKPVRYEFPDPTPMAPPVGYKKQKSMSERVREMVQAHHLQMELARAGVETFEEANDFEIDDDFDEPLTEHEIRALEGEQIPVEKGVAEKLKQGPAGFRPTDEELENHKKAGAEADVIQIAKKTFSGGGIKKLVDYLRSAPKEDIDKLIAHETNKGQKD